MFDVTTEQLATGYGLEDRGIGIRVPIGSRIFSSLRRPDGFGAHAISHLLYTIGIGIRLSAFSSK
jgi:hypothetical protein